MLDELTVEDTVDGGDATVDTVTALRKVVEIEGARVGIEIGVEDDFEVIEDANDANGVDGLVDELDTVVVEKCVKDCFEDVDEDSSVDSFVEELDDVVIECTVGLLGDAFVTIVVFAFVNEGDNVIVEIVEDCVEVKCDVAVVIDVGDSVEGFCTDKGDKVFAEVPVTVVVKFVMYSFVEEISSPAVEFVVNFDNNAVLLESSDGPTLPIGYM